MALSQGIPQGLRLNFSCLSYNMVVRVYILEPEFFGGEKCLTTLFFEIPIRKKNVDNNSFHLTWLFWRLILRSSLNRALCAVKQWIQASYYSVSRAAGIFPKTLITLYQNGIVFSFQYISSICQTHIHYSHYTNNLEANHLTIEMTAPQVQGPRSNIVAKTYVGNGL